MDPSALEERYAALQDELGAFNLGEAIRLLAQIPVTDERYLPRPIAETLHAALERILYG